MTFITKEDRSAFYSYSCYVFSSIEGLILVYLFVYFVIIHVPVTAIRSGILFLVSTRIIFYFINSSFLLTLVIVQSLGFVIRFWSYVRPCFFALFVHRCRTATPRQWRLRHTPLTPLWNLCAAARDLSRVIALASLGDSRFSLSRDCTEIPYGLFIEF